MTKTVKRSEFVLSALPLPLFVNRDRHIAIEFVTVCCIDVYFSLSKSIFLI